MPEALRNQAAKANARHAKRPLSPGVAVEVEPLGNAYVITSPHSDIASWEAMIIDAFGTRSRATAMAFIGQLTEICSKVWIPDDETGGSWHPDANELNMIINVVANAKPRNEMEALLAAQMVAVHLMMMKASRVVLGGSQITQSIDPRMAATAGKLARTFAMQLETLNRSRGRRQRSTQTIKVKNEKHMHTHQHVHVPGGGSQTCRQPHEANGAGEPAQCPALPGAQPSGNVVRLASDEGEAGLPAPRRDRVRRSEG